MWEVQMLWCVFFVFMLKTIVVKTQIFIITIIHLSLVYACSELYNIEQIQNLKDINYYYKVCFLGSNERISLADSLKSQTE